MRFISSLKELGYLFTIFMILIFLFSPIIAQELPKWSEPEPVFFWDTSGTLRIVGGDLPFISADGQHLFIRWTYGDTFYTHQDEIFVLHKLPDGNWSFPINLGKNVNGTYRAGAQKGFTLSPDLKEIYYCFYSSWGWKVFVSYREDTSCDSCWTPPEIFEPVLGMGASGTFFMSRSGLRIYSVHRFFLQRDCDTCAWDSVRYTPDIFPRFGYTNAFTFDSLEQETYGTDHDVTYMSKTIPLTIIYPLSSAADEDWGVCLSNDGKEIYVFRRMIGLHVSHRIDEIAESSTRAEEPQIWFSSSSINLSDLPNNSYVAIFDISGRKVQEISTNSKEVKIPINNLTNGVYLTKKNEKDIYFSSSYCAVRFNFWV